MPGTGSMSRWLRSISGRIILGYLLLVLTLVGVSAFGVLRIAQLGRDLRFLRTTYLEIALRAAKLSSVQSFIVDYLDGPVELRNYIGRNREVRRQLLEQSLEQIRGVDRVPAGHEQSIAQIETRMRAFLEEFKRTDALYDAAFVPGGDPVRRGPALERLKESERRLQGQIGGWFNELRSGALRTAVALERSEARARTLTLAAAGVGALLGLALTLLAVLTLRPLRRLSEGVRLIARGEYRERVDERGGTEVADLAREFNAMAAAIKAREEELVRSARLAAVGKMAAVITHEVRNPLSSIGLNAELLEDELGALAAKAEVGEAVALLRTIGREVDRLTAITEEYLRFARLPRPRLESEALNPIVAGLVEFQREELAGRGVQLTAHLAPELPLVALDDAQLRQALLNLVRNAADAISGSGEVSVETLAGADGGAIIRVADSGAGIPAEALPRIFEPFFSTKEKGTGLGLALTQQIVAEHGGRIEVESAPGRTVFSISLPAARGDG